jgi:hypothetical protein
LVAGWMTRPVVFSLLLSVLLNLFLLFVLLGKLFSPASGDFLGLIVNILASPADTAIDVYNPQNAVTLFTVGISTNFLFYWGLFWLVMRGRMALKRGLTTRD